MSETEKFVVVGLGEVLWDMLPTGKQLGGAPTNFAFHVHMLGDEGIVASRLGEDDLGREIRDRLEGLGLSTEGLQWDCELATGTVAVSLDEGGQPEYEITEKVAWDALTWTAAWEELAQRADAVCFGSLAQRDGRSRGTIGRFLETMHAGAVRVFDINLRQAYYDAEVLGRSLELANVLKLNDDELPEVLRTLEVDAAGEAEADMRGLLERFGLDLVCLTRGARGCLLVGANERAEHDGFAVQVADTVGAGDAFTAALTYHHLRGTGLTRTAELANRLGSLVAAAAGGTPRLAAEVLAEIRAGE